MADIKYNISFGDEAYNKEMETASLKGSSQFTAEVNKWNGLAQRLDRYDIFDRLQIEPEIYKERTFYFEGGKSVSYGIPMKENTGTPFYAHQPRAAERFLSELRAFGLLSDLVGAGKTFEAGIVLSELAVRGRISSALFIVPANVCDAWVSTMECSFGIGKWDGNTVPDSRIEPVQIKVVKNLKEVELKDDGSGFKRPSRPLLVKMEDFVKWDSSAITSSNVLFDVVVVDEAHHLSTEDGKNANAMRLLSEIMKIKKKADITYCLLLSATPHNGNLADMFRLWYFIRCKGGEPTDFIPKHEPTDDYLREHEFYLNTICGGATTIMDFVRKEKVAILSGGDANICVNFRRYIKNLLDKDQTFEDAPKDEREKILDEFFASETQGKNYSEKQLENARKYVTRYYGEVSKDGGSGDTRSEARARFKKFLSIIGEADGYDGDLTVDYDYMFENEKDKYITRFFQNAHEEYGGRAVKDEVKAMVAHTYHNRILRTIMIRQEHRKVDRTSAKKRAVNIMYFATDKLPQNSEKRIEIDRNHEIVMRITPEKFDFMNAEPIITDIRDGKPVCNAEGKPIRYTLSNYIRDLQSRPGNMGRYSQTYGDIIEGYLKSFGLNDVNSACKKGDPELGIRFPRANSLYFYRSMLAGSEVEDDRASFTIEPVAKGTSDFEHKYLKLAQILDQHKDERVIVFFDYDISAEKNISDAIYNKLMADERYKRRVVPLEGRNKSQILEDYDTMETAVLVAKDELLKEGTNLQKGRIIVNLQVPSDPLDMQQRIGRVHRIGQQNDEVLVYSVANMYELEGYVLAYFNRIGLICDNNGDAEILAGCNNENMVSIRCRKCHKVELISKEEFDARAKDLEAQLGLTGVKEKYIKCDTPGCEGTMHEIVTSNAICDKENCTYCKGVMKRRDGNRESSYACLYGDGTPCNDSKQFNRTYYCSKICALDHCRRFTTGDMKDKCEALKQYKKNGMSDYSKYCADCKFSTSCKAKGCILTATADRCQVCTESSCKPYTVTFDSEWNAPCPYGKGGVLRSIKNKCFSAYIRDSFELTLDGGKNFCHSFGEEIDKILEIQEIIRADEGDN